MSPSSKREYGKAMVEAVRGGGDAAIDGGLLAGMPEEFQMWMSHGDKLTALPEGFVDVGVSANSEHAAIANPGKKMWALQFHPEVTHSIGGQVLLGNFVNTIAGLQPSWDMQAIADDFISSVRAKVGPTEHVIGAVSGGVDSSVAAVLLHKAIGDRFHAVLVDNGLLRGGEAQEVVQRLKADLGINLKCIDAGALFLGKLAGVSEPERKRKIIGGTFIEVFDAESKRIEAEDVQPGHKVAFLLQGTLYPDVIESVSYKGPSATIKTHHNVGGLPDHMKLGLIEPLRELFKDEVRDA